MIDVISPARIVLVYVILSLLWIYFSDTMLLYVFEDPTAAALTQVQHFKGAGYILLTGVLLLWLLKGYWHRIKETDTAYSRIFETSPQPMWIFDKKTYAFLEVNDAALYAYGYSRDEFLNLTILDIRPTEDIQKIMTSQVTTKEGYQKAGMWRHLRKDRSIMYVNVQAYGTNFQGHEAEVVCVWDMTEKYLADEALKEQKRVLSTIINSTEDLIWSVNKHKRFVAFNKPFATIIGQMAGRPIEVGDDQPVVESEAQFQKWQQLYDRALEGEKIVLEEERFMPDLGQVFTETTFNPIFEGTDIVGVACFARDVTTTRQQAIQLKKAVERYDLVNLATNDAIWDWDLAEDKITWNDNVLLTFGYQYMIDDASHWKEHLHPDDAERVIESVFGAIYEGKTNWSAEFRFKTGNNTYRYVIARSYIMKNDKGQAVRMIGSMRDIQDRKSSEEEIRKLSLVASLTSNPVIILDHEGRIEWVNKAFELLSGYTLEEVNGQTPQSFLHGPDTNPDTVEEILRCIQQGRNCKAEVLNYSQWGEPYWVMADITPVVDDEGKVEKTITIQTNISEQKKFEQQLETTNRHLMEVAYISSHRLRRPVASLLGVMALFDKQNMNNPENGQLVSYIEKLTQEMDAMLHELADKCNQIYLNSHQQEEPTEN
ncbi:PAS domain S-box protein [Chitinophaga horti]|uniref:histidine kinase n=1 Tax=Chitinophaga horti TaxID=2920382 RepID=A0ABY6JC91_9BACT|nr:PAS domain S-box protein [Chitinophaga horti]UYQ95906.1 PAS domain S-box protein [Chitinophaga horti]